MPPEEITARLAEPFEPGEVKFKPAAVSGNRALALAYVDARVIQDRLDDVLGVTGWQDEYAVLEGGAVKCRLRCKIGDEWITKEDVGGQSEQPDDGDKMKAAFSDALKRAAVKFGVGRYLYRLPQQWCDYDPHKRQFTRPPLLAQHKIKAPATPKPPADPTPDATAPAKEEPVTEKEAAELRGLMNLARQEPVPFFEWASKEAGRPVNHLDELPARLFKEAGDLLKRKATKNAPKVEGGEA